MVKYGELQHLHVRAVSVAVLLYRKRVDIVCFCRQRVHRISNVPASSCERHDACGLCAVLLPNVNRMCAPHTNCRSEAHTVPRALWTTR